MKTKYQSPAIEITHIGTDTSLLSASETMTLNFDTQVDATQSLGRAHRSVWDEDETD